LVVDFSAQPASLEIFLRGSLGYLGLFILLRLRLKRESGTIGMADGAITSGKSGTLIRRNMRKELIAEDEILSYLRKQGLNDIARGKAAYMEGDGQIRFIADQKPESRPGLEKENQIEAAMFQRILVPMDGSSLAECVLPHILAIGKSFEAEITLLRVLDPVGAVTRPRPVDPLDWQIRKAEAETYLKSLAERFQGSGLQIDVEVREGKAAESVIEFARSSNADLILLSSHGQSGISGWNISSVVQKIILRAQTSVMIVRAYHPAIQELERMCYGRILLPLDGSQRAENVLPTAATLARQHKALVLVAHIVHHPEMPRRTPPAQEDIDLANQVVERNRVEAENYLHEIQSRLDARVETRLLVHDSASAALHALVEQEKVDLVILSAHGYTGDTRWPYGSLVISFIAYGSTPLLIMQDLPRGRIEPSLAELAAQERGGR
jgi:nucleotide-binding universal stress UspA family protein